MRQVLKLAVLLLVAAGVAADEPACNDSLAINDSTYAIPEFWCARWIDSTSWADPVELSRVPDRFTFEEYRIYLLKEARDAFVTMAQDAKKDSIDLLIDSGYRSPDFQRRIISRRLKKGEPFERIVKHVAPPGYSEHHTGRAFDLVPSEAAFAFTPAYDWLKKNAPRYGFRESYPEASPESLWWESWHWYYVGDTATEAASLGAGN